MKPKIIKVKFADEESQDRFERLRSKLDRLIVKVNKTTSKKKIAKLNKEMAYVVQAMNTMEKENLNQIINLNYKKLMDWIDKRIGK